MYYNPILDKASIIIPPHNCKNKRATIGDISIPPKAGIIFLKGAKNVSVATARNLKNGLFQLMFGIHVKKHLKITTIRYKLIKLYNSIDSFMFTPKILNF